MAETLKDLYAKLEKANIKVPDYPTFEKKYGVEGGADILYNKLNSANVKVPDLNTFKSKYFSSISTPPKENIIIPTGKTVDNIPTVTIQNNNPTVDNTIPLTTDLNKSQSVNLFGFDLQLPKGVDPKPKTPEQKLIQVKLDKFGYNPNLDPEHPNNMYATEKAMQSYQELQKETSNKSEEEIASMASDTANQLLARKKEVRNLYNQIENSNENLAYIEQGGTSTIVSPENQLLVNKYKQEESNIDNELNTYTQYFSTQRAKKLLLALTPQFEENPSVYNNLGINDISKIALETAVKLDNTGNFVAERANLNNAFEIDPSKQENLEILPSSNYIYGDYYKMPLIDRDRFIKQGASAQIEAIKYSADQDKEQLNQYEQILSEVTKGIGNRAETPEEKDYIAKVNAEKQRLISNIKNKANLELKFTQVLDNTKYLKKQEELDKSWSFYLDPKAIEQSLNKKGLPVELVGALSAGSHVLSSLAKAGQDLTSKVVSDIPSYIDRYDLRKAVEKGEITEVEELQKNLQRTGEKEDILSSLGMVDMPSYFKDSFGNKKQLFGFNEKGFYVNPEMATYEIAKTAGESMLLASPAILTEGLIANKLINKLLQSGSMIFTSEVMLSDEMIRNFEKQGLNAETSFTLGRNLARLEGFTESMFIPETKLFSRFIKGSVEDMTEDQIKEVGLKNLVREIGLKDGTVEIFNKYINIKKEWANGLISSAQATKQLAGLFTKTTLSEYKEELIGDVITPFIEDYVASNDPSFNPDKDKSLKQLFEQQVTSFLTVAATMSPTAYVGAKREYQQFKDKASYLISQNPEFYLESIKKDFQDKKITEEEYLKQTIAIKNAKLVGELSTPEFTAIDKANIPSSLKDNLKIEIFSTNNNIEDLKRQLSRTLDVKQKEQILGDITKLTEQKVEKITNQKSPKQLFEERENAEISAVNNELSDENVKSLTQEQKQLYISSLEQLKSYNTSEKLNKTYQDKIDLLSSTPTTEEVDYNTISDEDYAYKVLNLPKEEIEDLQASGELQEKVKTDRVQKEKIKQITSEFEEAKNLQGEERKDVLTQLSLEAAGEGLSDLAAQIYEYKDNESTVKIGNIDFPINAKVIYDGKEWEVIAVGNTGKLVKGNTTVIPSDPENIKLKEEVKFIEGNELADAFGVQPVQEEPTLEETSGVSSSALKDVEGKKADIERLEKEKQKTLKPLIEEKEQIEKEIEEIEKAADSREEKGKRNNIVPISTKEAERLLKHLSKKYGILGVLTDLLPEFTYGKFTTEKILINKNTYYDEKGDITFESKGFVNKTTIYHEYLHPFVQILERVNPELYEKIYQDSLSSDIDVSHYIKDVRKEERVVRYLDKLSAQEKTPSLLQQFFDFLSDLFFKNKKSDYRTLQKLNTNTTVEELYNIFKNYGNLREGSEKVKEERFLKLEATQLENLINLNAGDVESHKTELEIIKQKLDLLNRYDVDKLQQLKQKLAEVNKKIDAITKRFDAQIAQKQSELKALEEQSTSAKKAYIERRRQELESSREIETLYDLRNPIAEDSKEIISKIEEANKLRKEAKVKSEQAAKETNEEKRIALNSDAASLNEKAQILDKEVKASRDSVINNTPIKQAITSAKILGQKLLNKIKLAAKSNEWVSSMPISKEEFTKFEDAIKRLSVKNMGEVTSNSEVIPDILLIEEINAKYDAELNALEDVSIEKEEIPVIEPTTVIEENPIIEETPVVNTPEAKQEAKNNKKQLDNPVNPFRNTYFERGSVFANVITNIFNSKNKEDYFVTVTSSQNIPWEQLPQSTKEYFKENDSKKRIEDKGKYLVITDKEGKPFEFNPDGTKNNEKGAWAIDVFPVTKSETELKDGRFEPTNIDLEKQGKTREWFLEQVKKIHEARQSNEPITYTISNIHQGGYEVVKNESIPIKQSLDGKNAIVTLQGGKAFFQIEGESTPNEINRPLFTQNQIDTILHIVSNKGTNQTDTKEKQQFVTKLVGSNFYRKVDGKKLSLYFDFNKGLLIPKVKYEGDVDFTIITNEQLAEILAKITPNIDKLLLDSNLPFNNYTFNGKTVSKKVYNRESVFKDCYSDFILDTFYTYNNVSSTEITPEYYLEVGEPVNSSSNKIEQASQEVKESLPITEKKEVTPTITQDSPVQKTKTERKKYKIDDDFDFKSILGDLKRSKNLITQVTKEQELKAKEWYDINPISQHINYRDFRNVVNSDAFATWWVSGLTLYKGSKFTDLYHEAWHEFSQLYLTKAQKIALYNEAMQTESGKKALEDYAGEIGKSVSELTNIEKYFAIEEMIAEDFLKYVLSNQELILDNRPKRNTIFRKIFNFIKELFTGKTDLQGYYERLYTGNLNNYKRNLDNAFFGTLNKGIEGVVNGEARNLSNEETTQLYEGIDAIFGRIFEASKKPITLIFEDNNVIPLVYKGILNYFKTQYNNAVDRQSNLDTDSFEYEEEQKVLDNLEFILQNWNEIIAKHKRYSNFFNISRDNIKFDEEGNLVDTSDLSEEVDENNLRDASIVKNENISSKEAASNETIYLVATLSKSKNVDKNTFLPMVDKLVDFKTTWDVLTKHLENTLEYNELIDKITNLSTKYPWANDLLDRLPDPNKELLSDAEQRLKSAFLRDIGKPKVDTYELVLRVDGKSISTTYNKAVATDEKKLKDKWNNNFATLTPLTNPFIKEDESGTYLDTVEVKNTYESAFPRVLSTYNNLDKNKLFTDRLAFISNLGIEFSEEALSSPEFFKFITRQNSPITDLYKLFTVLSESTPKSYNPIKNLSDLKLDSKLHSNIEYFYKTLVKIVKEELKYSDTLFTQSVKNAENNTVWQIREWNYISKVYNALNDINKYPTYQSLISEPWLKQFSVNSNPYVKGVFLNTLFNLETGERRKDRNGNYAKIELQDYNGITVDLKKGTKNEGKTTTGLTDFEKLVQNFNTLLLYGVQEHLRYGDKSSSYATHISHIYNPVTNQLENRSLIVPIDEFIDAETNTVIIPGLALDYLKESLKAELIPMKMNYQSNFGNNWKYYKDNIKDLGLFEGMLSKKTKDDLMEEFVKSPDSNINEVIYKLSKKIDTDLSVYLRGEKKKLTKLLSHKKLSSSDFISAKLLKQGTVDQLHAAYVVNSLLYNIEHTKLVTGDPRFYKAKGGKKDPFKRFSQFTAGGTLFLTDEQTNKYIQSKGRAIKDAVAKKLNITIAPKIATGMINSVIFNDATYNSEALRKQYTDYFLSKGYSQEYIDNLLKKYEDITEADGQGYTTLDELRESKLRAGSSHWTKAHEIAYQKEADFLAGKTTEGMSEEELVLFVPQKWQYSGTTIDNGFTVPVFYKFSVAPLIPSMIKGTSFEQIHDNLIKQNIGLALFESGSKHSAILNEDGKFNPFYSNYSERTPFEGEYTINPIFYNYLKEQVNIEPELKGEVPFSTQMRKLLHLNLFKEGKPIHPRAVELEKKFADVVDKLISLEKENVISQMGATLKDNVYTFDAKKLQEFFQTEFEKRGLSDEVIDYFQVGENGQFTYPLDASNRRDKIEKIIYSIANKRLVQQKVNGEALIQLAATGFELNSDKFKEVKEDAGLPFYRVVDGVTQAMKVKIAFSDKWKPLLKLKHPDNQPINTLDRLNEAIKDEKWLKEHYKKITIVGVRIPVQGLNSQEFMEVYHFLPESAGNVIIVSPYLVAKSGGDFDIDKLTIFFPNLFENRYTGEVKLYNSKDIKFTKSEVSKKLKEVIKPTQEKFKAFKKIRKDLKDEIGDYKSKKEELTKNKQDVKRTLRKLDIEIAFLNQNLDILQEAEFALLNEDDLKSLSQNIADTIGLEGLVEATQSAIEQTKNQIRIRINEAKVNQTFLLKLLNKSLSELREDVNYTRLNIKKVDDSLNPLREYLINIQELIYQSSAKKAYENELVDIIRDTLSLEENFEQLITPNDTDLLEELAQKLKELDSDKPKNTWTELVEFQEIARQFKSNLVGKYNLAIVAVWNTFFALSQRGGLTLNDYYINTTSTGKKETIPVRINLPHNTSDGKVSLSGLMDVDNQHKISRIFEQAINGFVDIAKDDWIFFINGVKEIVPTMLFTAAAGVNNKNMIAFFNQPIIKDYVKEVQTYRNLFVAIKDAVNNSEDFQYGTRKALENMFIEKGDAITNKTLLQLFNKFKADYEEFNKVTKKPNESKQAFKARQTIPSINKNKSFKALLQAFQLEASKNKELFTTEKLNQSIFDNKQFTAEEELTILAHFEELKQLAQKVSNLQRSLNADTKKASDSTSIYDRKQRYKDVVDTKLFPEEALNKMFNESTVKAFTNTSTGFDAFVGDLFTNLLEITNNPTFNKITRQLVQLDNTLKFEFKSTNADALSKVLKNDFITYLYQNNVFWEDSLDLVAKKVGELFKPKTSLFNELIALKLKYPDLSDDFPILNQLVSDKKGALVNIKLKSRLSDRDELNSAVYQIRQLLHFNNPSYTQEEQLEVQNFAKKFTKFAIIQSGLNPSIFNLMDLIPNEEYTKGIAPFIQSFKQILDTDESLAKVEISKFYNRFRTNNPTFYQEVTNDEGSKLGNYDNTRGKNYLVQSSLDLTGKKKIASDAKELEYLTVVPTKVELSKSTNSATMRNNPNSLILVENNAQLTATKGLKETNYASIITKEAISKPLVDENLLKNQEIIDTFIKNIIDKSKEFTNIVFNENGYGQHLLPNNPKTFDYLSHQLYKYFKFTNPNFNPLDSDIMNQEQPTTEEISIVKKGVIEIFNETPELANAVYEALGFRNKHWSGHTISTFNKATNEFINKFKDKFPFRIVGSAALSLNNKLDRVPNDIDLLVEDTYSSVFYGGAEINENSPKFVQEIKKVYSQTYITGGFDDVSGALLYIPELNLHIEPKFYSKEKLDNDKSLVQDITNIKDEKKIWNEEILQLTPQQKQQAQQKFQEYIDATGKQDIKGFKEFINKNISQVVDKNQLQKQNIIPQDFTNHSGGAKGGDMQGWDKIGREFGVNNHNHYTVAYYDKLSTQEKDELDKQYLQTVKFLGRGVISKDTYAGKLVRRDMIQANNGEAIYGVTELVKPTIVGRKGYKNKNTYSIPEGGTGYAVARGILLNKPTYVFNQSDKYGNEIGWYKWDSNTKDFVKTETPTLTKNFTGIGSQEINELGLQAIRDVYQQTLNISQVVDSGIDTNRKKLAKETNIGDIFYDSVGNLVQRISLDDYRQYSKIPESTSGVKVKILKELVEIAVPNANPKLSPTTKKELIDVKENKVNTLFENSKITQELKPNIENNNDSSNEENWTEKNNDCGI